MAAYLIQTGPGFTITGTHGTIDVNVVRGVFTIDNEFHDERTFTVTHGAAQEFKGRYQGIGHVEGFLDDTAVSLPTIAHFEPGTAASTVVFTLKAGKVFTLSAHVHNWSATGDRQGGFAGYTFDFRSYGAFTSITDT